jgi:alkylation response protein AidB-like acyl-CoA dehydrogenase
MEAAARAYEVAAERGEVPVAERVSLRLAATNAASVGADVTTTAYRLGGGSALYDSSPLQRRFRDAQAATQHMLVGPATWELTGRLLLGMDTDVDQL